MTTEATNAAGGARGPEGLRLSGPVLAALFLAACLAPVALALGVRAAPASAWEAAGAALGLAALPAMVIQFFVSGRFETVSGHLGIDRIMAFHKIAGWWVLIAILLHPLVYIVPTFLDDPGRGADRLAAYLVSPRYTSGVVAWAAVLLLVLGAALRERLPWTYEVWRATHLLLAVVAVAAASNHAVLVGRFSAQGPVTVYWMVAAGAMAGAVAILYGWRWLQLHRRPWRLESVTPLADRIWELDIQPEKGTPPLRYRAGQFVWMTVGARRFPLFDHPFSIADSPLRPGLSLIVKELGDFTNRIGQLPPGAPVGIDGPYGDFVLEDRPDGAVLLIAGGSGVGPIMGLLRDLVARRDPRPIRLAYGAGAPAKLACREEIEAAREVLDLETLLLSEVHAEGWDGPVGILDRDRLQGMLHGLDPATTHAMICGPGGMVTAVSDTLLDLGLPMDNIVYERFDYAADATSRQDRRNRRQFLALGAVLGLGVLLFGLIKGV